MQCCVRNQLHQSERFPVQQGIKQGGIVSPFLYLVYDNDLIWDIEEPSLGLYVYNINCGSPAVADYRLILSVSKLEWLIWLRSAIITPVSEGILFNLRNAW